MFSFAYSYDMNFEFQVYTVTLTDLSQARWPGDPWMDYGLWTKLLLKKKNEISSAVIYNFFKVKKIYWDVIWKYCALLQNLDIN